MTKKTAKQVRESVTDIEEITAVEQMLLDALHDGGYRVPRAIGGWQSAENFDEAGVYTDDKGIVLTLENGRRYQITIVRSA